MKISDGAVEGHAVTLRHPNGLRAPTTLPPKSFALSKPSDDLVRRTRGDVADRLARGRERVVVDPAAGPLADLAAGDADGEDPDAARDGADAGDGERRAAGGRGGARAVADGEAGRGLGHALAHAVVLDVAVERRCAVPDDAEALAELAQALEELAGRASCVLGRAGRPCWALGGGTVGGLVAQRLERLVDLLGVLEARVEELLRVVERAEDLVVGGRLRREVLVDRLGARVDERLVTGVARAEAGVEDRSWWRRRCG